jgi:hypothetical protein
MGIPWERLATVSRELIGPNHMSRSVEIKVGKADAISASEFQFLKLNMQDSSVS